VELVGGMVEAIVVDEPGTVVEVVVDDVPGTVVVVVEVEEVVVDDVVDVVADVVVVVGGVTAPLSTVKVDGDVTTGSYPVVPFALTFSRITTEMAAFGRTGLPDSVAVFVLP